MSRQWVRAIARVVVPLVIAVALVIAASLHHAPHVQAKPRPAPSTISCVDRATLHIPAPVEDVRACLTGVPNAT